MNWQLKDGTYTNPDAFDSHIDSVAISPMFINNNCAIKGIKSQELLTYQAKRKICY